MDDNFYIYNLSTNQTNKYEKQYFNRVQVGSNNNLYCMENHNKSTIQEITPEGIIHCSSNFCTLYPQSNIPACCGTSTACPKGGMKGFVNSGIGKYCQVESSVVYLQASPLYQYKIDVQTTPTPNTNHINLLHRSEMVLSLIHI